jgi:hypothetical protein
MSAFHVPAGLCGTCLSLPCCCDPPAIRCLRWASALAIGVRGGWPANEVQQVLSACARGEDWQALRDKLQTRRTK